MRITGYAEVRAVLSDTSYVPPPPPADAAYGTLGWLRSQVSRFAAGAVHAERRALVEDRLSRLDAAALRTAAATTTRALLDGSPRDMAGRVLAHGVPARVLGHALGVHDLDALAPAVETAATGYLSGVVTPDIDAAVARLLTLADVPEITILLQAHGATTALLRNALARLHEASNPEELLHQTLRHDPPVSATKRVDPAGVLVEVDLTPDLAFGHGPRRCPGSGHAMAIATGILETIMEYR
ncbi:hypothetical protein ACFXJ8_17590 [Nonomuraea sp. NPDC059194]|uniref:hypothetical protein n=1 Tax=Nonomuraea sp. NPDC059194 TaxID=3346764 RepID=UPI0036C3C579